MRISKIMLIILVLCSISVLSLSCTSEPGSPPLSENQVITVQRGDLTVDVTAAGNLALSRTEDLAFEIAGTVEELLVEEGDTIEEGQVLAKLDTATLEEAVRTAERAVQQAELDVTTAETGMETGELTVKSAEIDLEQATNDYQELTAPYPYVTYELVLPESVTTLRIVQARIEEALEENQKGLTGEQYSMAEVKAKLLEAEDLLAEATTKLAWGFGSGIQPSNVDYWTLRENQIKVEKAQLSLDTTLNNLDKLEDTLDKARINLDIDKDNLAKAIDELEKAVIVAPFEGFITQVNVEGGDEVLKGTVAVQLADPNKFEVNILVSEMDILQVKLGGEAWVQVDAMQGMSLPAEVTRISPTATIQSGVVNYEVKVEVESLEAVVQERQQAMPDISSGELPERVQQAIEEGQITQEQAEEMIKQMQQAQETRQGQVPTIIHEDFQLREGLTVTVSIIVEERHDVLLVPNAAITSQGGQSYVQVVSPDGTIEERMIQTGVSDWQFTEVTSGLSEGEQVAVLEGMREVIPATQSQRPPGGIMIPGTGGHP